MDMNSIFNDLNESIQHLLMFANEEGIEIDNNFIATRINAFAKDRDLIMEGHIVNKYENVSELIITVVISCYNEEERKIDMRTLILKKIKEFKF